jgi:hypothetical protein
MAAFPREGVGSQATPIQSSELICLLGSAGMGLATAKGFVQEGMDQVFITGHGKDALDAAAAEIGKNVAAKFRVDVSKIVKNCATTGILSRSLCRCYRLCICVQCHAGRCCGEAVLA